MTEGSALVLFSGGQDSTTCLLWALAEFDTVNVVSFDYGQRHAVELEQAVTILTEVGRQLDRIIPQHTLHVPALAELGGGALTNEDIWVEGEATEAGGNAYAAARGLPSTYVPGRNLMFISTAAGLAGKLGAADLVTGICAMDRSGYPDCRAEFASAMETTLRVGLDWPRLTLHTPVLFRSKAETWALADDVAGDWGVELVRRHSHTCYHGIREVEHEWGFGCGDCPACVTRANGWNEFRGIPVLIPASDL